MQNETLLSARRIHLREPINGLTHALGAVLAVPAMLVLLHAAKGNERQVIAFSVYGVTLFLLYAASALYHLLPVRERARAVLRRIDHMMIYVPIAGTYTPICMVALHGAWGTTMLTAIWLLTLAGMCFSAFWLDAPRRLATSLYVAMGWMAVVAIVPLVQALPVEGLLWMLAGGAFYTVGAFLYAVQKPNPFPGVFGFHEIWHLFVLAGSAAHFMMMFRAILPMA